MATATADTTSAPSREDFAAMLDESFDHGNLQEGSVVKGTVIGIEKDLAVIDVGLKTEGRVPLREFSGPGRQNDLKVGDEVEVYLERVENALGEAVLVARQGAARGKLGQAGEGVPEQREGLRRHLQPGERRLHRRSRRRRGVPAAQRRSTSGRSATSPR